MFFSIASAYSINFFNMLSVYIFYLLCYNIYLFKIYLFTIFYFMTAIDNYD